MRAAISSKIFIERDSLPPALETEIRAALTIVNPDKERALSEHIKNAAELPDELWMWSEIDRHLVVPRGIAHELEAIATRHGEVIEWDSSMTYRPYSERCFGLWPAIALRDYQVTARDEMIDWASGIMQAPTASGKTRVALEVARWCGQPTIVIVDKTSLAQQWVTAIKDYYGATAGMIGDGEWEMRDITIALRQSLWARRDSTDNDFWAHWGMVILDEVHHASAETLTDLIQRFPAYYRLGYSATPVWDDELFPFIKAIVGPVVHRTLARDIGEVLVTPRIVSVPTRFEHEFIPTHMDGRRRVQNNYNEMMAALVEDSRRNGQIVVLALDEARAGHHVLITTRRTEHVARLVERLSLNDPLAVVHVLTGKQSKIYERVREEIAQATGGTILVSTIADEALDIPRLDRLIMAYPARRVPLVEQQIGRLTRPAPGKTDAIVYDIYDERIGVMKGQHRDRTQQLYLRRRWPIGMAGVAP